MTRQLISIKALNLLIADLAKFTQDCRQCTVGSVVTIPPDDSGCNWKLSRIDGGHCGDCFSSLLPTIYYLRSQIQIAPESDPGLAIIEVGVR